MFTPQEVSEKTFPKTSALTAGYNMAAVDEFLDPLTEDYTALYKENAALKAKLKVLAEKIEEYRSTEDAMRTTLVTAQKLATKLVQEAQTQKDEILNEARAEAARQTATLEQQTAAAEQKLRLVEFLLEALDLVRWEGAEVILRQPAHEKRPENATIAALHAAVEVHPQEDAFIICDNGYHFLIRIDGGNETADKLLLCC